MAANRIKFWACITRDVQIWHSDPNHKEDIMTSHDKQCIRLITPKFWYTTTTYSDKIHIIAYQLFG